MRRSIEPSQGEVWDIDFSPTVGREQGGLRPALVISNERFNRIANGLYIVVPITGIDRGFRHHLRLLPPEGNLPKPSVAMCDQVRSHSELRFRQKRGDVSTQTLEEVRQIVSIFVRTLA